MTSIKEMNAIERFDLAQEIVNCILEDPEFDEFFKERYNGKIIGLDDDPLEEFKIWKNNQENKYKTK